MTKIDRETVEALANYYEHPGYTPDSRMLHTAATLRAQQSLIDIWRDNSLETHGALCAMRDSINEYVPMPSVESDLLQGPENSVFCETVAGSVISHIRAMLAENAALRDALDEAQGALEGIDEASNHYAMTPTYSEGTLRYAHKSTRNLARATLANIKEKADE